MARTGHLLLGNGRISGIVGDGACVGSVLEADVAGLAPFCAPRVAHLPVGRGVHARGLVYKRCCMYVCNYVLTTYVKNVTTYVPARSGPLSCRRST